MIHQILGKLASSEDLSVEEARVAFESVMQGQCTEAQIAALLTALRVKKETVDEIVGAAEALRRHVTPIEVGRADLLDTCGTGGDGAATFNISTAAALVTAAAGVPVAKHGNRSVSSSSGSADVLSALGVNVEVAPDVVARCIRELGFGFCYAPILHVAMRHAAPVRRQLRFRTIFNLVGPLTNPARAGYQLLGVGRPDIAEKLAQALGRLGTRHALVVCGEDGLDEVSLSRPTNVYDVRGNQLRTHRWAAEDFGLAACDNDKLVVSSPEQSAEVVREVLNGRHGPQRDIVLANAAAALMAAERVDELRIGVRMAAEAIDQGQAIELLGRLITLTNEPPSCS